MSIEMSSDAAVCSKCGRSYSRRKGYFPVSYAVLHKGIGHIPVCKDCIDKMYNDYLAQCNDAKAAVRQMCRKLDLFWSDNVYEIVSRKSTTKSMMTQYIAKINSVTYAGKSYDDTLSKEGTLWRFKFDDSDSSDNEFQNNGIRNNVGADGSSDLSDISPDLIAFWGEGYQPEIYRELENSRKHWVERLPEGTELDIGTETLIRHICYLESDIRRQRIAGQNTEKATMALNALLGSANLKPVQKKQDDLDTSLTSPLGVWLYRYEKKRPLPEIDKDLKDVNGNIKYVMTWVLGHICKMLGIKNAYSKLYEDEIARLKVEKPEYDGEDDETFLSDYLSEERDDDESDTGDEP